VFAAIIPVAPATGAAINPARTFGPMLVQQLAGGTVKWGQLPVYWAAELLAGVLAALAYGLISRTPADASATEESLTPASMGDTPVPVSPEGGPPQSAGDAATLSKPATTPRSHR
jgi:hypothetical protein